MKEHEVQRDILAYLRARGILHGRHNVGRRGGVQFGEAGWPDIIACYKGRFVGIECKGDGGEMRTEQLFFRQRLQASGGLYIEARCLDDVIGALDGVG